MKVLFATTNPAKIRKYVDKLKEKNIEVLTLKDLSLNIKVEENGKSSLENAKIKAEAYYNASHITTISMDCSLFIEGVPEEKQPGTHVRRVNGKELTDDEALEHYIKLVKEYGGKLKAKWVYGMAIYNGKEAKQITWDKSEFYFVDKPSEKRNSGYPLDSISIMPDSNKYFVDLTREEKDKNNSNEQKVIDFIINTIYEETMATQKAGTVLVNLSNKKIALVYRRDKLGYEFPKGHLEEGETLEECASRETEEETGRKNHIVEKLETLNYITGRGEDVQLHMYLAIDDGRTHEIIDEELKEVISWFRVEEVESNLNYENLKRFWRNSKQKVIDLLNNQGEEID